ncbi:unnamed protein product [Meganyctiphanes norvegica]|uniref:Uncharacterized protein n=1 Tax=Meganyctiphanes norvegica TaxID=48144 RepID=A0AAV2SEC8_MEGNR
MDLKTADPIDIVNALREKLIHKKDRLTTADIERLIPPSLKKKDQHNIPHYVPGTLRRQREEAHKYRNAKGRPMFRGKEIVPQEVQEGYMNKFYDAVGLGKFAHISNDELVNLETEIRNAAADSTKHTELEEFIKSIEQEAVVPEGDVNLKEILEPFEGIPEPEKIDMVQAFNADEMPPLPRECPIDRVDSSLPVIEEVQFQEEEISKTPLRSRTISETLEALVIATEFAEQNNCSHFIDNLDSFIAHLSCLTTASLDPPEENHFEVPIGTSEGHGISSEQQDAPAPAPTSTENLPQGDSQVPLCDQPTNQTTPNIPTTYSMDDDIVMENGLPTKPAFLTEPDFDSPLTPVIEKGSPLFENGSPLVENGAPLMDDVDAHFPPAPAPDSVQHLVKRKMVMNNNKYHLKKNPRPVLRSQTAM